MKNRLPLLAGLALLCAAAGPAPAQADTFLNKFGRGILNLTTGWMEVPLQVGAHASGEEEGGIGYGLLNGFNVAFRRTLYGLWDTLTFPFPPYEGPTMDPETLESGIYRRSVYP